MQLKVRLIVVPYNVKRRHDKYGDDTRVLMFKSNWFLLSLTK